MATGKKTLRRTVREEQLHTAEGRKAIAEAAAIVQAGGTVAFPTETVYGLGANALDAASVRAIFAAKQRPSWDPVIVHVADARTLARVVARAPDAAQRLMDAFWPGPLTLLLPRSAMVPMEVTAGRGLVGVRMPAHPVALALIEACHLPIAAPSANLFGHTSPTTATHVLDDLDGRIDMVLDSGPTKHGVESTVLEVRDDGALVYRPGAISLEELQSVVSKVTLYAAETTDGPQQARPVESLPSPGVGIRHYAPRARVVVVEMAEKDSAERDHVWVQAVALTQKNGQRCGILLPEHWPLPDGFSGPRYAWGDWSDPASLAHGLYSGLRALDAQGVSVIVCPLPAPVGMGATVRDRILKAARSEETGPGITA